MKLFICVYDLAVPLAVAKLVSEVGETAARDIVEAVGDGLFVVFGRDEECTVHNPPDEACVLEGLAPFLAEVGSQPPGDGGLTLIGHVRPQFADKLQAMISEHERHHTAGAVSVRLN